MIDIDQDRPSDAEFDQMIAHSYEELHKSIRDASRPWWRRMSRFTVITSIVIAGGVAGGAYAATQALFPPPPEVIAGGSTVIHLDKPASGDKWLNVAMAYTCKPGERFTLKSGDNVIFDEDCDAMYYNTDEELPDGRAPRGVSKSVPIGEVEGRTLTMDSTLSRDYRVEATFGPIEEMQPLVLPGRGDDGKVGWAKPDYEVNEYGLTVGVPRINTPEDQWPDLYPVLFEGREAYFLGKEINEPIPLSPERRREQHEERLRLGLIDEKGNTYQRVYAADGKTVLGKKWTGTVSEK